MKFFLVTLFLFFFYSHFSFSQKTEKNAPEIPVDTIEGSSTDTSIVYIIKKPPVTIREKVEVERAKIKKQKYYYLSMGLSGTLYSENRKANPGYENYLKTLNTHLKTLPAFGLDISLWKAKPDEKIITGLTVGANKLLQQFTYKDTVGGNYKFINNYNYCYGGAYIGKWIRKGNKISFIPKGGMSLDYFTSVKGFTLNESNTLLFARINRTMHYHKFNISFNLAYATLLELKNSFLEIEPYAIFSPFSSTPKNEVYSLKRNFIGVKISYANKLF